MDVITNSVAMVAGKCKHVSVNQVALERFAGSIQPNELEDAPPFFEKNDDFSLEQSIAFGFVFNAINFSYWGDPKWTVTIDGNSYDGSAGMQRAMRRGLSSGYDLLSAEYLSTITAEDLHEILRGNIVIPLFAERLAMLRALGQKIASRYDGSFTAFVDSSEWDAVKLVEQLAEKIPEVYNDEQEYCGLMIKFYKRAQLVSAHLHELYQLSVTNRDVTRLHELTALADYKIPQILRKYGVLTYTPDLARRIDSQTEIVEGSEEEVEIRAMTVWAIELLSRQLGANGIRAAAVQIDHVLWLRSQQKSPDDKPYHRTRTTAY